MKTNNMKYTGLTVKGGRLINERPNGITGIQEAAMIRKARKMEEKANVIAAGILKAEIKEDRMESMKGMSDD